MNKMEQYWGIVFEQADRSMGDEDSEENDRVSNIIDYVKAVIERYGVPAIVAVQLYNSYYMYKVCVPVQYMRKAQALLNSISG
jgi:hypothetical protein